MRRFKIIAGMRLLKRDGDPEGYDKRTYLTWNKVARGLAHAVGLLE